jgi:hypothetical protein
VCQRRGLLFQQMGQRCGFRSHPRKASR